MPFLCPFVFIGFYRFWPGGFHATAMNATCEHCTLSQDLACHSCAVDRGHGRKRHGKCLLLRQVPEIEGRFSPS